MYTKSKPNSFLNSVWSLTFKVYNQIESKFFLNSYFTILQININFVVAGYESVPNIARFQMFHGLSTVVMFLRQRCSYKFRKNLQLIFIGWCPDGKVASDNKILLTWPSPTLSRAVRNRGSSLKASATNLLNRLNKSSNFSIYSSESWKYRKYILVKDHLCFTPALFPYKKKQLRL